MALQQTLGLTRAILDRIRARQTEGIETVQIPASRQNLGRAQQITAGRGTDITTVECAEQAINLMDLAHQLAG